MRTAILAIGLLALAGCASETTTGGDRASDPAPITEESNTPGPRQTTPPTESPAPQDAETTPCEEVMFNRAQNTIRSQQRAFANGDFRVARGYASDSFRESVSVEQFQSIIEGTYAFLLEDPAIEFIDCQRMGDIALIELEVAGSPVVTMAYRVVLENESWFIDAAAVAGSREDVTA